MEAVLEVLEREGIEFPVILLAKQKKLPSYKLAALRERFANARFIDLDWEVDYDNGKSFKNSAPLATVPSRWQLGSMDAAFHLREARLAQ
eukprot:689775-Pleurochrysis_carterae.AAC.2